VNDRLSAIQAIIAHDRQRRNTAFQTANETMKGWLQIWSLEARFSCRRTDRIGFAFMIVYPERLQSSSHCRSRKCSGNLRGWNYESENRVNGYMKAADLMLGLKCPKSPFGVFLGLAGG